MCFYPNNDAMRCKSRMDNRTTTTATGNALTKLTKLSAVLPQRGHLNSANPSVAMPVPSHKKTHSISTLQSLQNPGGDFHQSTRPVTRPRDLFVESVLLRCTFSVASLSICGTLSVHTEQERCAREATETHIFGSSLPS